MKELNTGLVSAALKAARAATCGELARTTGLSVVTVAAALRQIVGEGKAWEAALVPSNGGRPARRYEFNREHSHVLVIFTRESAGEDTVYLRVCDLYGEVVYAEEETTTPRGLDSFEPLIDRAVERFPSIRALAFGLPGIELDGTILMLDYPSLAGSPIVEHFRNRYGIPVLFENDVNAAVMGYRGRWQKNGTVAYVYFPVKYPPGSGISVNGGLLKGRRHFAGEVSFLPLGIDWRSDLLYTTAESVREAVARVVVSLVSVLDPDIVMLYGEFLDETRLNAVRERCAELLPERIHPVLELSADFGLDIGRGLAGLALDLAQPESITIV